MGLFDSITKGIDSILGTDITGEKAIQSALDSQMNAAGDVRAYYKPWQDAGQTALKNLQSGNLQFDPGYQFRMDEGLKALQNSAIARGMSQSGSAMKSLSRFGQGLASQEYGNAWNRQKSIADYGFGATNALAGNATDIGNAQGSAAIAKANGQNQILGQLVGSAITAYTGMPSGSQGVQTQMPSVPQPQGGTNYSFTGFSPTRLNNNYDFSNYSGGGY